MLCWEKSRRAASFPFDEKPAHVPPSAKDLRRENGRKGAWENEWGMAVKNVCQGARFARRCELEMGRFGDSLQ